jgi:hypothetical protein
VPGCRKPESEESVDRESHDEGYEGKEAPVCEYEENGSANTCEDDQFPGNRKQKRTPVTAKGLLDSSRGKDGDDGEEDDGEEDGIQARILVGESPQRPDNEGSRTDRDREEREKADYRERYRAVSASDFLQHGRILFLPVSGRYGFLKK